MSGLVWFLVIGVLFFFMMRGGCGSHVGHGGHHGGEDHTKDRPTSEVDPVCGMRVQPDSGYAKIYRGARYRFCSRDCLGKFDASPDQYLGQKHDVMGHQGHPS